MKDKASSASAITRVTTNDPQRDFESKAFGRNTVQSDWNVIANVKILISKNATGKEGLILKTTVYRGKMVKRVTINDAV